MKTIKRNTDPLSPVEWDTCWMAIRYAMNRMTAASASLPGELLSAYFHRWSDRQKQMIVRDLRDNLEDLKRWNETDEAFFGDKGIDHPIWMRFLLTLDNSTHKIVTLTDGSKVECIEYNGKYHPLSDHAWWNGAGATYMAESAIVLVEDKISK